MSVSSTLHLTSTQTHITNPNLLRAVRIVWFVTITIAIVIFIAGLPHGYTVLRESPRMGGGYADVLAALNVSQTLFAAFFIAIEVIMLVLPFSFAILVVSQRSDDWLALLVSASVTLSSVASAFTTQQLHYLIGGTVFSIATTLIFMIMLVFPDGTFQPAWSRYLLLSFLPIFFAGGMMVSRLMGGATVSIPIVMIVVVAESTSFLGILAQVYRYRTVSNTLQRQQTKWLIIGASAFMLVMYMYVTTQFFPALRTPILFADTSQHTLASLIVLFVFAPLIQIGLNLIPISIALAVLRYRLWNVDIVLNRSLVYVFQTVILVIIFSLIFFFIRVMLAALVGGQQELLTVGISAAVVAAAFNPVRQQARRVVDRYMFGLRFDLDELDAAHRQREIKHPGVVSGKVVDGYEVLDVIGRGGMGEVYKGFGNDQTVAIKTMLFEIAQKSDMRVRFHREAEIGKTLHHRNVVKVFASGEIDGTPYMVMEYIEGGDLSDYLDANRIVDEETATQVMQDVCGALNAAHEQGFVHRDMKPSNVMIRTNGEAILMDFGVTKVADASSALTGTGAIGTIDYMAPEQITAAKDVDYRADIYALGVMLYEMMTGEKPFKGSPAQILFAHLQQPVPDPLDINPDIPQHMAEAIEKAMSKDPDDRFQSAGAFATALTGKS